MLDGAEMNGRTNRGEKGKDFKKWNCEKGEENGDYAQFVRDDVKLRTCRLEYNDILLLFVAPERGSDMAIN